MLCEKPVTIGHYVEIGDLKRFNWSWEAGKEVLQILPVSLGPNVLPRRNRIEYKQTFIGEIASHDGVKVLCFKRCGKALFKIRLKW